MPAKQCHHNWSRLRHWKSQLTWSYPSCYKPVQVSLTPQCPPRHTRGRCTQHGGRVALKRKMATSWTALAILPLLLLCYSRQTQAQVCQVPEFDQQFCNSFYSVCISAPNKQCLAKSMAACMDGVGFPSSILESLKAFLYNYLLKITPSPVKPVTMPPVPPTFPPVLPTFPPMPLTIRTPKPTTGPVTAPPEPIVEKPILITIETGNSYLDYLIAILESQQQQKISSVIRLMIERIRTRNPFVGGINWETGTKVVDISTLMRKIKAILQTTDFYFKDYVYVEKSLSRLLATNTKLLSWFSSVIDEILVSMEIVVVVQPTVVAIKVADFYGMTFTSYHKRRAVSLCHDGIKAAQTCEKYCTASYGNGWIGIQARERQTETLQSFDLPMKDYMTGFGDWNTGYWMGLQCLHDITHNEQYELLIEMTDASQQSVVAHYDSFRVGNQKSNYELHIGTFLGGTAGDSLRESDGSKFTTRDHDADEFKGNCAGKHKGGWWYKNCMKLSTKNYLNGYFSNDKVDSSVSYPYFGVRWQTWNTPFVLTATRMFIRKKTTVFFG